MVGRWRNVENQAPKKMPDALKHTQFYKTFKKDCNYGGKLEVWSLTTVATGIHPLHRVGRRTKDQVSTVEYDDEDDGLMSAMRRVFASEDSFTWE